ncbi:hypothetical protein BJ508DRAFT_44988 [Ascobolus immersus RN42]|uniref:Uncharacterized protein n=1 Tax=Ascobolus immersus RN42 TaxID=1160509 RepID=A0A3N4HIS9_ASCIM|nr:hypothetical protein BJ508DRAFT_44988 [Ascobolus immersus RN42]
MGRSRTSKPFFHFQMAVTDLPLEERHSRSLFYPIHKTDHPCNASTPVADGGKEANATAGSSSPSSSGTVLQATKVSSGKVVPRHEQAQPRTDKGSSLGTNSVARSPDGPADEKGPRMRGRRTTKESQVHKDDLEAFYSSDDEPDNSRLLARYQRRISKDLQHFKHNLRQNDKEALHRLAEHTTVFAQSLVTLSGDLRIGHVLRKASHQELEKAGKDLKEYLDFCETMRRTIWEANHETASLPSSAPKDGTEQPNQETNCLPGWYHVVDDSSDDEDQESDQEHCGGDSDGDSEVEPEESDDEEGNEQSAGENDADHPVAIECARQAVGTGTSTSLDFDIVTASRDEKDKDAQVLAAEITMEETQNETSLEPSIDPSWMHENEDLYLETIYKRNGSLHCRILRASKCLAQASRKIEAEKNKRSRVGSEKDSGHWVFSIATSTRSKPQRCQLPSCEAIDIGLARLQRHVSRDLLYIAASGPDDYSPCGEYTNWNVLGRLLHNIDMFKTIAIDQFFRPQKSALPSTSVSNMESKEVVDNIKRRLLSMIVAYKSLVVNADKTMHSYLNPPRRPPTDSETSLSERDPHDVPILSNCFISGPDTANEILNSHKMLFEDVNFELHKLPNDARKSSSTPSSKFKATTTITITDPTYPGQELKHSFADRMKLLPLLLYPCGDQDVRTYESFDDAGQNPLMVCVNAAASLFMWELWDGGSRLLLGEMIVEMGV